MIIKFRQKPTLEDALQIINTILYKMDCEQCPWDGVRCKEGELLCIKAFYTVAEQLNDIERN